MLIYKPVSPFWPCLECINDNNARAFSAKALPLVQIGRKTTAEVAQSIAAYIIPWHNAQAAWRRQYVRLVGAMEFWKLSNGPINFTYTPEPEDPMNIILDMLYPGVGPEVTKEELKQMPPPKRWMS